MRVGISHHFGWAVAVTASIDHEVVDRRRIELIEPGMPAAPIHQDGRALDHASAAALVAEVRASATRATSRSLDELVRAAGLLADRADTVLRGPRATLGPPWGRDHRAALAATIVAE